MVRLRTYFAGRTNEIVGLDVACGREREVKDDL